MYDLARLKELDATKLKPNVNVEEVSKEVYSSDAADASIKASEESKATSFKNMPKSSSRIVDSFDVGIENFSSETLKEKITSWRYDDGIQMLTTYPKGCDFENYVRRMSKDGSNAFKKNPKVPRRRLTKLKYNIQVAIARRIVRSKAPSQFQENNELLSKIQGQNDGVKVSRTTIRKLKWKMYMKTVCSNQNCTEIEDKPENSIGNPKSLLPEQILEYE
ncbi:hypothetical protein L1987_74414 [Smallanthus sonchifolius]|uniref:Uncharacterized protein n=1 Tax=Smallanthus sonchifolius TaxID=185202 RepID=A0ACB9A3I7_9ASTR|nr:hypothetical protein L1987_74414 [Smallanthus sonchifolius]